MIHPGKKIIEEIRNRNWTQKQFAILVGKKNSEVNELIKGKRNITIQRDYALSQVLGTPEKYRINMQTDYDYEQMKEKIKEEKNKVESFEVVEDIPSNNVQEVQDIEKEKQEFEKENIEDTDKAEEHLSSGVENKELVDNKEDSLAESDNPSDKSQNDNKVEISEEERQKRKEMKKIFINF